MYAHVTNGTVDAVGNPPEKAFANNRWWDLRPLDLPTLAICGWYPFTSAERPADTATTRWESVLTFSGSSVVQSWQEVQKTPEELTADTERSNEQLIKDRAQAAYTANMTFLGLTTPSNAQVLTQVQRLTKEANAFIRLHLRDFSDTEGTE